MTRRPASSDPTLTVDVLADIFPLNVAVFIVPVAVVVSDHLTAVLSRLVAPVIGLALHPETEGGQIKAHQTLSMWIKFFFFFLNTALGSGTPTTNTLRRRCRRSTPRRPPPLGHSGRSRTHLRWSASSTTAGGEKHSNINNLIKNPIFSNASFQMLHHVTLSWMSWMLIRLLFCSKQKAFASSHVFISLENK